MTPSLNVIRMKKWMTAVAVVVGFAGAGLLVYWQWDPIWAFVFSPLGGFVTKIVFGAKAVKVVVGATLTVGAGWVAVRKKLRRGTPEPEPEQQLAPPVYGPPEEATPPVHPAQPPAVPATPEEATPPLIPAQPPPVLAVPATPPAPAAKPPTYGPPQEAPVAPAGAQPPAVEPGFTSTGTGIATTTETSTAPTSRPI